MASSAKRKLGWLLAIVAALGVMVVARVSTHSPEPDPGLKQDTQDINSAVNLARTLKRRAKNPPSFDLVEVRVAVDRTICVTYRATNSFGAVVTERALNPQGGELLWASSQEGFAAMWNKSCVPANRDVTRMVARFM